MEIIHGEDVAGAILAVLMGIGISFAADSDSILANDKRWRRREKIWPKARPPKQGGFRETA